MHYNPLIINIPERKEIQKYEHGYWQHFLALDKDTPSNIMKCAHHALVIHRGTVIQQIHQN